MSRKYHIKPDGEIDRCRSYNGRCPFDQDHPHFNSKEEAGVYFEKTMEENLALSIRGLSKEEVPSPTPATVYKDPVFYNCGSNGLHHVGGGDDRYCLQCKNRSNPRPFSLIKELEAIEINKQRSPSIEISYEDLPYVKTWSSAERGRSRYYYTSQRRAAANAHLGKTEAVSESRMRSNMHAYILEDRQTRYAEISNYRSGPAINERARKLIGAQSTFDNLAREVNFYENQSALSYAAISAWVSASQPTAFTKEKRMVRGVSGRRTVAKAFKHWREKEIEHEAEALRMASEIESTASRYGQIDWHSLSTVAPEQFEEEYDKGLGRQILLNDRFNSTAAEGRKIDSQLKEKIEAMPRLRRDENLVKEISELSQKKWANTIEKGFARRNAILANAYMNFLAEEQMRRSGA